MSNNTRTPSTNNEFHIGGSSQANESNSENKSGSLFSPVQVTPLKSPQQGNLTGSARKIKDSAADWHNYIQSWDALNTKGISIVNKIANIKLEAIFDSSNSTEDNETGNVTSNSLTMLEGLENLCLALDTVLEGMTKIVTKLETVTAALKGVRDLEWHQNVRKSDLEPIFQTWPVEEFYNVSEDLLVMYQNELELKRTIMQNVAHAINRETLMFYTSTWLHQPYIEKRADTLVQGLLIETGLKQ